MAPEGLLYNTAQAPTMTLPPLDPPNDETQLPAARRRQQDRSLFGPLTTDERSRALEEVVTRAAP
jgi:hypothetical protein